MDFYQIKVRQSKKDVLEVYPDFKVCRSQDLMVRGKSFYAIWDEEKGMWSTDEYDVQRLIDDDILRYEVNLEEECIRYGIKNPERVKIVRKKMSDFSTNSWVQFRKYINNISDNAHQLDESLTFQNTEVKKEDYVSRRLNYSLEDGKIDAYDELMSTLYSEGERRKLEWAIGAVVSGDAKDIQKFIVLYGKGGTGKSTVLEIIQSLFEGYYTTFEAKALTSTSNAFSTEVFKSNPLVAIQHEGDLSRIEDNSKFNSVVAHEYMTMNEKYKPSYMAKVNCFLFIATNKPVKITDGKSGIIRRLIDVSPTGEKVPEKRYNLLRSKINFELGAIAKHCLDVYRDMGKDYYSMYRPFGMMLKTDVFYNFVEAHYVIFDKQDGTTLKAAYEMYKRYCDDALVDFKLPRHKFREELKNYFKEFHNVTRVEGKQIRSYYKGFLKENFIPVELEPYDRIQNAESFLEFKDTESIFDEVFADCPAQYASRSGTPMQKWDEVKTKLADLDTTKLHYVKLPKEVITVDFDLKDDSGKKSLELNRKAAEKWPATYGELSMSGQAIHMTYIYDGDVDAVSNVYSDGIEIKKSVGNSSLRRRRTKTNNIPIARITSGLPLKGGKKLVNFEGIKDEQHLRNFIKRCIKKEHHGATKPEIDFIFDTLKQCYNDPNMKYDVSDMYQDVLVFATNSSHNADYCLKLVSMMPFKSEEHSTNVDSPDEIIFFDVEVFPNLFVVVWKRTDGNPVKMINPTSQDIEELLKFRLVGFNNRRYDNHILYARLIGYTNEQLYHLSQKIISGNRTAMFGEAYNLSYADIYDFSSKKQSLKKFEIELGIHHQELGMKWDEPVPEDKWMLVADYCINDVMATQAVFEARQQDFIAREVLADVSGLTVNDTTQMHTAKIIFGNDRHPQEKFVYTDLSEMFPGYKFEKGRSFYRGEDPGEGGYVYSEPGMYGDVALLDIASMHPTSIEQLNLFGPYTQNFSELKQARIAIKHRDYDTAKTMLGGALEKYLKTDEQAEDLSYALKIVINSVYGLTSAKFDNKFKDPRNVDNIVAKRGALFMIDLKHAVQDKGYQVAHIKTDSIKIPDATPEIIKFVMEFGKKYGYTFEHEATYDKMCLVNDAVYIARYKDGKHAGEWTATGAQFQQPYVFKTLFSKEPIMFKDMCETKTVSSALYLDMNESLGEDEHDYHFVGKAGQFSPIKPNCGGGILLREKDGKYNAATGTKGYRWMESEMVEKLGKQEDIDQGYYTELVDAAVESISKYGDFEWFVSEDPYRGELLKTPF